MNKKIIAIVGDSVIDEDGPKSRAAYAAGRALIKNGYRIQSGGRGGVMRAAFAGAKSISQGDSDTIAILPSFDIFEANEYADIVIPTGLDFYRNGVVAAASAVVAIGGGAGTLSEIAFAWSMHKLIIAFQNVEGWSRKLAGQRVDGRARYSGFEDKVFGVWSAEEMVEVLDKMLPLYNKSYGRIID
ncbi:MAG: acyl-CoA synthetase [Firmicutes bacterium]|nr:acyl-CoA synthetase [Bacillota bacterium]